MIKKILDYIEDRVCAIESGDKPTLVDIWMLSTVVAFVIILFLSIIISGISGIVFIVQLAIYGLTFQSILKVIVAIVIFSICITIAGVFFVKIE